MKEKLSTTNIILLGFTTFCMFVGAGNIIMPPIVGFDSSSNLLISGIGFLLSAVGLPILTVISLARFGGNLDLLSKPLGKILALIFAITCYLIVGPLFATPRTAAVSLDLGIKWIEALQPYNHNIMVGGFEVNLLSIIFTFFYFLVVIGFSLYPTKLLDSIGKVLAPIKIIAILILCIGALLYTSGNNFPVTQIKNSEAIVSGLVNGYQTMDTFGALVFGIVIVHLIKSRNIKSEAALTKYSIYAGLMAGAGMIFIYICLMHLGASNNSLFEDFMMDPEKRKTINGAIILQRYTFYLFGHGSDIFLAILITIVCLVTAIGLTCACAEFFSSIIPLPEKLFVILLSIFAMIVSNIGLTNILNISIPILFAIYPVCLVLVILSFFYHKFNNPSLVVLPTALVALFFGITDGLKTTQGYKMYVPRFVEQVPLVKFGLAFLIPCIIVAIIFIMIDRFNRQN